MPAIKLTYFDMKGRAEPARLALHLGGIPFTDERVAMADFPALKQTLPLGQLPVMTVDGKVSPTLTYPPCTYTLTCTFVRQVLGQSKAIVRYCGRLAGLYPTDALHGAQVDEVGDMLEDLLAPLGPTFHMADEGEKQRVREDLVSNKWPKVFAVLEARLVEEATGFFVGSAVCVCVCVLLSLLFLSVCVCGACADCPGVWQMTVADLLVYVHLSWLTSGM